MSGGPLVRSEDGALLGGGLLDLSTWLPAIAPEGVWVSDAIARALSLPGEAVLGAVGFVRIPVE